MVTLAEIGLGVESVNTPISHHPPDFLAVEAHLIIPSDDPGDHPVTPGGMRSVQFVYAPSDKQVRI